MGGHCIWGMQTWLRCLRILFHGLSCLVFSWYFCNFRRLSSAMSPGDNLLSPLWTFNNPERYGILGWIRDCDNMRQHIGNLSYLPAKQLQALLRQRVTRMQSLCWYGRQGLSEGSQHPLRVRGSRRQERSRRFFSPKRPLHFAIPGVSFTFYGPVNQRSNVLKDPHMNKPISNCKGNNI